MPYEDGWAALNLEMPKRVPRTEYSVEGHWDLLKAVTGIDVGPDSSEEIKLRAQQAFYKAWHYSLKWSILVSHGALGEYYTDMGHAVYQADGSDLREVGENKFPTHESVLNFDPWETLGPIDRAAATRNFENHSQKNSEAWPDQICMTGIYITCLSGLIGLFGWDMLLLAAGIDMKRFSEMTDRYTGWIYKYYEALADADVPVVMVHDDMVWTSGPFLPPSWYREHVFPHIKRCMAPLIESGKRIIFTSDGDYTLFFDDVVDAGAHGLCMEPCCDMKGFAGKYGKTHAFIGNADTRILLNGTREAIRAEVERCFAIGKDCPGFFMSVGNHIPANTPVENALYYNEVYEELAVR
jgi:uroporphyrinogen decarboxylase